MTSPTPSAQPRGDSPDSHYFAPAIIVVAIMLVVSNVIAIARCSPCHLGEALRRFFRPPEVEVEVEVEVSDGETSDAKACRVIPALRYQNEKGEENASDEECSVCLSSFLDGEYIRQLPPCKHSFHASCIDTWLYSRSNCPLCRASVPVRPPPRRTSTGPQRRRMEFEDAHGQ